MSYDTGSIQEAITLFNEGAEDIDNARFDSGRSKLQEARQNFEQCQHTHAEAKSWLAKTNQKLSNI